MKKQTAKNRREAAKAEKMAEIQKIADKRRAEEQKKAEAQLRLSKETELKQREEKIKRIEESIEKKERFNGSKAKAAGLKSIFVLNEDELLITSFGKGNAAIPEQKVKNGVIIPAAEKTSLSIAPAGAKYNVSGRIITDAIADNPLNSEVKSSGQDLIGCKAALERQYFGKEYKDNIHVQIAYSVLDIEKILTVHVNNIVFAINNMLRFGGDEYFDLVGYMGLDQDYIRFAYPQLLKKPNPSSVAVAELFEKLLQQPQLGYFGNILMPTKPGLAEGKKGDGRVLDKELCYYYLAVVGEFRQATAHGLEKNRSAMFRLEAEFDKKSGGCRREARASLDKLYSDRVKRLNGEFLDKANKDLYILFKTFGADTEEKCSSIVRDYYKFIVLKQQKNLGFSIKHLRETISMFQNDAAWITDDKYSSFRAKIYHAVDFTIYEYYMQNSGSIDALVDRLRASISESEKEAIYRVEAEQLWYEIRKTVNGSIKTMMTEDGIAAIPDLKLSADYIGELAVSEKAHTFSEAIYLLTHFLDGKEINDLLTKLINKFEIIASFRKTLEDLGREADFCHEYSLLNESEELAKELRAILRFARMTEPAPTAKKQMLVEAAEILGFVESDESVEQYIDNMLNTAKLRKKNNEKNANGFRNFIINNVIESSRFKYLVRYGNPKKIRKLAENRTVIDFALKSIPDAQILRYYNSCNGTEDEYTPEMRDDLAERISGLHFNDFEDVYQGKGGTKEQEEDKERKKSIIRLYLTVLYLIEKNLVYVNARYFIAFHCAERDGLLHDSVKYSNKNIQEDRAAFAKFFVETKMKNKKARSYLQQNFENSDNWSLRAYRNCVEHMNAVRNADKYIGDIKSIGSYFELYHYLVQRSLIDQFVRDCRTPSTRQKGEFIMSEERACGKLLLYMKLVMKYGTYCKDFVKALNVPFAYNLPRYKNLSINELFDMNDYKPNLLKKQGFDLLEDA